MSWRRRIGAAIGVAAIALATVTIVAPNQILRYLPPTAETTLTQQPVQPLIAVLLAVYAGWMVLSRGWLSPIREELAPPTDADTEEPDETGASASNDEDTHSRGDAEGTAENGPERISFLGRNVLTFGSQTNTQSTGDAETTTSTTDTEANDERDLDSVEETEPTAVSSTVSIPADEFDSLRSMPPEQPQSDVESVVGSDFDEILEERIHSYGRRDDLFGIFDVDPELMEQSSLLHVKSENTVRNRLVALASELEQSSDGTAPARGSVDEWTTEAAVKSFLDPTQSDNLPLIDRIRVWLLPEATFERLVEESLETLEDAHDGGRDR
jgi:hypothetical protein